LLLHVVKISLVQLKLLLVGGTIKFCCWLVEILYTINKITSSLD